MSSTFFEAPSPKWYFFDAEGRAAVGGHMYTYSSLDHSLPKPIFSDAAGLFPYLNPMVLDGTGGTEVPIFWEDNGTDRYYVVVKDDQGRIIFTVNDYPITGSGSSPPPITQNIDIQNYIINGNFHLVHDKMFGGMYQPGDTLPFSPIAPGTYRLAPGGGITSALDANAGQDYIYAPLINDAGDSIGAPFLPDTTYVPGWVFIKEGGDTLTDTISFPFTSPGVGIPDGPSANAPRYFQYHSNNAAATTELDLTYVMGDVRTFAGQQLQITFDAYCDGPSDPTEFIIQQHFGSGGSPSSSVRTSEPFTFPNGVWERISLTINVPDIDGKNLGTNNNHRILLRWRIPENNTQTYGLTNLQATITVSGIVVNDFIYDSFNHVAALSFAELASNLLPQTGDIKLSLSQYAKAGWIVQDSYLDTIGKTGATFSGQYVKNLYVLVYESFDNSICPVSGGRTGNAFNDFDANKTMQLPPWNNTVMGVQGVGPFGTFNYSNFEGARTHTLTVPELAAHSHGITGPVLTYAPGADTVFEAQGSGSETVSTDSTGSGAPFSIIQPTSYWYLHIKL
jgi:hypothetical protein